MVLRRAVDAAGILAAIGLIAAVASFSSEQHKEKQALSRVSRDLDRFREALSLRAASDQGQVNARGWPITVDPTWFGSDPPRNAMVSPDRPWVEIATPEQASLKDPPVRLTLDGTVAGFWYNPYQGIVRARVPIQISDRKALELYNTVNGTRLDSIYGHGLAGGDEIELFGPPAPKDALAGVDESGDEMGPPAPSDTGP
jgi:hypothetical protein